MLSSAKQINNQHGGASAEAATYQAALPAVSLNAKLLRLRASEREIVSEIISCLSEVDRRRVYREWGYPSLFEYCTRGLGYSESAAFRRIAVARSVRKFPQVLEHLKSGWINLTAASLIAPHLTSDNARKLIEDVAGKTQNQVKEIVALLAVAARPNEVACSESATAPDLFQTQAPVSPVLRLEAKRTEKIKLVVSKAHEDTHYFRKQATSFDEKLRYELRFSVSRECQRKLDRARVLMSSKYPRGASLEETLEELLDGYLERSERKSARAVAAVSSRVANRERSTPVAVAVTARGPESLPESEATSNSMPNERARSTRHIPAAVRRQVIERDSGRCAYVSPEGMPCGCEWDVEVDHVVPFSLGGSHAPENLRLLCRAHNMLMAEQVFGESAMRRFAR